MAYDTCDVAGAEYLYELVQVLEGTDRSARLKAARAIALLAREDAQAALPAASALVGALALPEAQTRWESLNALAEIAVIDPEAVEQGFSGAEDALFDEDSALVRQAGFRYLARLGATSPDRSQRVWPLMAEAVQCYHGDPGYREMLGILKEFAAGDLGENVRAALFERMDFDAKNGRGLIRAYAKQVCDLIKEG